MLTGMSWAQSATTPAPTRKAERGPARMFQQLDLTADQRAKVQSILQSERSQVQALRSNTSLTDEQKKQQVRELRKNDHQQLLAVLTPEQQAKLKQLHSQRKGRAGAFRSGRGFQALNLTDQQKQQLKPVFQSTRQQMQALRSDTTLTPEQKREKMKEIRQNQMAQMKSILTPEQQQQLHQMRGRRMRNHGEQQQTPPSA
jgi:Spy/CpxP family protein refolding chaperone